MPARFARVTFPEEQASPVAAPTLTARLIRHVEAHPGATPAEMAAALADGMPTRSIPSMLTQLVRRGYLVRQASKDPGGKGQSRYRYWAVDHAAAPEDAETTAGHVDLTIQRAVLATLADGQPASRAEILARAMTPHRSTISALTRMKVDGLLSNATRDGWTITPSGLARLAVLGGPPAPEPVVTAPDLARDAPESPPRAANAPDQAAPQDDDAGAFDDLPPSHLPDDDPVTVAVDRLGESIRHLVNAAIGRGIEKAIAQITDAVTGSVAAFIDQAARGSAPGATPGTAPGSAPVSPPPPPPRQAQARQAELAIEAAPPAEPDPPDRGPRVLIMGLLPAQTNMIRREFDDFLDLRFWSVDDGASSLRSQAQHADLVVSFASHMRAGREAAAKSAAIGPFVRCHGGVSSLRKMLVRYQADPTSVLDSRPHP